MVVPYGNAIWSTYRTAPGQWARLARQPFGRAVKDDRSAVASWLPARIPGDVRADLLAAGRISALDTPEGIAESEWVDDSDWWYRTEIDAAETGFSSVVEADGIDYLSSVWAGWSDVGAPPGHVCATVDRLVSPDDRARQA